MQTQKQIHTDIVWEQRLQPTFLLKFPRNTSHKNCCFHESGWLLFPSSSPDYWTHWFPVKAFRENFNVTSYYTEDTIHIGHSIEKRDVLWIIRTPYESMGSGAWLEGVQRDLNPPLKYQQNAVFIVTLKWKNLTLRRLPNWDFCA